MITQTKCLVTLSTLVDTYQIQAKTEGKSSNTIRIYSTALTIFERFLERQGYSSAVTEISPSEIREFIGYLQDTRAFMEHPYTGPQTRGLTGHTINCYLRALRAFWSWLVSEELIESNPFDKITIPKAPKKIITPFTEDQVRLMLSAIDTKTPVGFRDWAIILVLLDTGTRVSEMTDLRLDQINLAQRSLRVLGKGNKEREVPIGVSVQRAIAKYINKYRPTPVLPLSDNLFLTREGFPLTANRVQTIIETRARLANIQGVRTSPHTFRHTFAITYLRNGGDVFTLQRILGHETLDMVRNYVYLAQSDLQEAHLRCSPVDNMRYRIKKAPGIQSPAVNIRHSNLE